MYTVYLRENTINAMQYVGQTKNFRKRQRCWNCLKIRYANFLLTEEREKYGLDKFTAKVLAEVETQEEAWELEEHYIKELNTKYPNGYNMGDGGNGTTGVEKPYWLGKHHSDETKKKCSENNIGKKHNISEEAMNRMIAAHKGKHPWNYGKKVNYESGVAKKVNQYSKENVLIKTWDSIAEAARTIGGQPQNICHCCNGGAYRKGKWKKCVSAYGYIWRYA